MTRDGSDRPAMPDVEVVPMAERRRYTAEENLCYLEEATAFGVPGEIDVLVRREGMSPLYLSSWSL